MSEFKIYLVGGAVRDKLLHRPIKERDWVVVGANPSIMQDLGYKPVGKDFPVFLHPQTHEEYALARSEKKVAPGYQGFVFHTSPDVTLEQDLMRRDLTINAIAQDNENNLIDPYHGFDDLNNKMLRHVSDAFVEDPVRLLRIARFSAYLPDFSIHPTTMTLLQTMVKNGEVDALVPERVWAECVKACSYADIRPFFKVLDEACALKKIFPNLTLDQLDFDSYQRCALHTTDRISRWGALWHLADFDLSARIMERLKVPKSYQEHVQLVQSNHCFYENFSCLDAQAILQTLLKTDAIRRPQRLLQALETLSFCVPAYSKPMIQPLLDLLKNMDVQPLLSQGFEGKPLADAIHQVRLGLIENYCGKASSDAGS
jgi:tRNA nucleotidyltransferase (CCA-adding enzyme)